jgi:imidazolonepropionase-like amidohydrolase
MIQIMEETNARYIDCIRNAVRRGVKVALGSDFVGWNPAITPREFQYLVELGGMTPIEAIYAGTISAAELLDISNIGQIKTNYKADIVIINGNPIDDITLLESHVSFVMKDGIIIRNENASTTSK